MVQIRHEDLRLIAELMKDWVPPHHARQSLDKIKQGQAAIIPLLTASKVSPIPSWWLLILGFPSLLRPCPLLRLRRRRPNLILEWHRAIRRQNS